MHSRLFLSVRSASQTVSRLETFFKRSIGSTSHHDKEFETPTASTSTGSHISPAEKGTKASAGISNPSSCPPGTILSGLSLYKDRADPVALPDADYPSWLWTILEDPNTSMTSASGVTLESTAGLSKGEARAAQKRNMRAVRATQQGRGKANEGTGLAGGAGAGAGMKSVGESSEGIIAAPAGEAEQLQGVAAIAVEGASAKSIEDEKKAKKALRKANREKIKARNFIGQR